MLEGPPYELADILELCRVCPNSLSIEAYLKYDRKKSDFAFSQFQVWIATRVRKLTRDTLVIVCSMCYIFNIRLRTKTQIIDLHSIGNMFWHQEVNVKFFIDGWFGSLLLFKLKNRTHHLN